MVNYLCPNTFSWRTSDTSIPHLAWYQGSNNWVWGWTMEHRMCLNSKIRALKTTIVLMLDIWKIKNLNKLDRSRRLKLLGSKTLEWGGYKMSRLNLTAFHLEMEPQGEAQFPPLSELRAKPSQALLPCWLVMRGDDSSSKVLTMQLKGSRLTNSVLAETPSVQSW